jgi:hypothetical protein
MTPCHHAPAARRLATALLAVLPFASPAVEEADPSAAPAPPAVAAPEPATEPAAPAPPALLAPADALLCALREAGVAVDAAAASNAFEAAILRSVDPGGRLLTAGDWERLQAERDGRPADDAAAPPPPAVAHATPLPRRLAWLKLNVVRDDALDDILRPIREWTAEERAGLVLDLRGACGRGREAAARIAEALVGSGFLFAIESAGGDPAFSFEGRAGRGFGQPVIVLIDRRTTGAAELLATVLAGLRPGALAIGETTAGDAGLRAAVPLDGGRFAYALVARLRRADGSIVDGRGGLDPDVAVDPDAPEPEEPAGDDADGEDERFAFRRHRRQPLPLEEEDRALREKIGGDRVLRRAVDLLLGIRALDRANVPDHTD